MYKFLNVEVPNGGDIIYNSRIGPSVGEALTLQGLIPNMYAKSINNKKNIYALPTTKHIFMVPEEDFFLFKEKIYVFANEPICICALRSTPHKYQSTSDILWK